MCDEDVAVGSQRRWVVEPDATQQAANRSVGPVRHKPYEAGVDGLDDLRQRHGGKPHVAPVAEDERLGSAGECLAPPGPTFAGACWVAR
jgi:hypothetical protein